LTVHLVWATKYRYQVLVGEVKPRWRDLLIQVCQAEDVDILKGVVSSDQVHMQLEYPPKLSVSDLVKGLKGRSWRKLQEEFPRGVSTPKAAILGESFLGDWVWGME